MDKILSLKKIMQKNNYFQEEIDFVVENLNPEWFDFNQSDEEIENQLYRSFGIWRGLGDAIGGYLLAEKHSCIL